MRESFFSTGSISETCGGGEYSIDSYVPAALEESSNGIREIDLRTVHLNQGKLLLFGDVNDRMAMNFTTQMMYLADKGEPVSIYINSPGGSIIAGLAMIDIIKSLEDKLVINTYCVGMAYSMGAVLLAGGQKGRRFILPHSKVMIHEPLISGGTGGSASTIKKTSDSILETKAIMDGLLAEYTGKTKREIAKATSFDNFMNAEEAVKFGICDEIRNLF